MKNPVLPLLAAIVGLVVGAVRFPWLSAHAETSILREGVMVAYMASPFFLIFWVIVLIVRANSTEPQDTRYLAPILMGLSAGMTPIGVILFLVWRGILSV